MKYYIDSSVLVKWFKKDEENADIALQIRNDILNGIISCYISEYSLLEIVRALKKSNYDAEFIEMAYSSLKDLEHLNLLNSIQLSKVRDLSKDIQIELSLFASDALQLASAIYSLSELLIADDET